MIVGKTDNVENCLMKPLWNTNEKKIKKVENIEVTDNHIFEIEHILEAMKETEEDI